MDVYSIMLNRTLKKYMRTERVTADQLAAVLGITRGTFYAKLSGHRPFTVKELCALADKDVPIPPMDADARRVGGAR